MQHGEIENYFETDTDLVVRPFELDEAGAFVAGEPMVFKSSEVISKAKELAAAGGAVLLEGSQGPGPGDFSIPDIVACFGRVPDFLVA